MLAIGNGITRNVQLADTEQQKGVSNLMSVPKPDMNKKALDRVLAAAKTYGFEPELNFDNGGLNVKLIALKSPKLSLTVFIHEESEAVHDACTD